MREGCDVGETEGRAASLDGVRDAEDGVDQLGLGRADVELEKGGLHRVERLKALFEEGIVKLCQVYGHGSLRSSLRPRSFAAAVSAGAAPRHSTSRPSDSRSRTN